MKRRKFVGFLGGALASSAFLPALMANRHAHAADANAPMDVFTALKTRRSARAYTKQPVTDAALHNILEAAMLAPSAANEQPWEFIVIRDKKTLLKAGEINPYASFAHNASAAIVLCLNEHKEKIKGMGIIDMGTCAENLMLAAHGMGIGSVFTGIYPLQDRIKGFRQLCGLPDYIIPIGMIVLGYPEISGLRTVDDRFNPGAIHKEKWE